MSVEGVVNWARVRYRRAAAGAGKVIRRLRGTRATDVVRRGHLYYRRYSLAIFCALLGVVPLTGVLLFSSDTWNLATTVGLSLLPLSVALLFLNVIGYDLMPAVTPTDVLEDLQADRDMKGKISDIQTQRDQLVQKDAGKEDMRAALKPLMLNFLDEYRDAARLVFMGRMLRYMLVLFLMLTIFACISRVLVLTDGSHYKDASLAASSDFVDHLYFAVVTLATIGYGDISPTSWEGRLACILEGLMVIFSVSVLLNYIMAHEGKRDERLREALTRHFDVAI